MNRLLQILRGEGQGFPADEFEATILDAVVCACVVALVVWMLSGCAGSPHVTRYDLPVNCPRGTIEYCERIQTGSHIPVRRDCRCVTAWDSCQTLGIGC